MFADIAGFTGLSERLGDQIIPLLSRYLDTVSREVSGHGGTIDKFIGDAVMAFWGAPAANPDHAVDACRAALACHRALRQSGFADDHGRPIKVRIGINSGDMLVGNIGSEFRLNYTVIGDAVNVASRLEGANKEYGTESSSVRKRAALPAIAFMCASSTGSWSTAGPADWRSTNCSASPRTERSRRAGRRSTSPRSPPIAPRISPAP